MIPGAVVCFAVGRRAQAQHKRTVDAPTYASVSRWVFDSVRQYVGLMLLFLLGAVLWPILWLLRDQATSWLAREHWIWRPAIGERT